MIKVLHKNGYYSHFVIIVILLCYKLMVLFSTHSITIYKPLQRFYKLVYFVTKWSTILQFSFKVHVQVCYCYLAFSEDDYYTAEKHVT